MGSSQDYHWCPYGGGIECGNCYANYQRHNSESKCDCRGCMTREQYIIPIHQREWRNQVSTLNICDRCSTPATSTAMGSMTYRPNIKTDVETRELCPGCVAEFEAFMIGTSQKRPNAYKEPYTKPERKTDTRSVKQALRELIAGKGDDLSDDETAYDYLGDD